MLTFLRDYAIQEFDSELRDAYDESISKLNNKEISTIIFYYQCGNNITEMARYLDVSYATLRQRISRIKRKLKAQTFVNLGMMASKKIVTPQLNDIIKKFLERFKKNLKEMTLHKMHYYFSEIDLNNFIQDIDLNIKKIIDYEINLIGEN